MTLNELKIQTTQQHLNCLLNDHSEINTQLNYTIDAGIKAKLKRQLNKIKEEIQENQNKLQSLQTREHIKNLMEDYQTANTQLNYSLSEVDRNRLRKHIATIEKDIVLAENKL